MINIGTITEGTLRPQDILPALMFLLEREDAQSAMVYTSELEAIGFSRCMDGISFGGDQPWETEDETIDEIIDEIEQTLRDHVPPYCYIGTTEGDGAHLGVWPDVEAVNEDVRCGAILQISDLSDVDVENLGPDDHEAVCLVNDRGNMTLYTYHNDPDPRYAGCRWIETWSVV